MDKAPVAAVLATSSFEFVLTILALSRLGYAGLYLSTRLAGPGLNRLLELADCYTIITTESHHGTIQELQKERNCVSVPLLRRQDWKDRQAPAFQRECDMVRESRKIGWIIHSSGSTGLPKPIFLSHYACLANFRKCFALRTICFSPLFHSHGLMELFRAIYPKQTMYMGNHSMPVTRANVIAAMEVAKPEVVCTVPYILKLLAETEEGIQMLSDAKLVIYAGSSCPDYLGDRLVARGVNLVGNYGA